MKKIFLIVIGVAAALFLGSAYWVGGEVEEVFQAELARVRQAATLAGLVVEGSTFKRGFFRSLATVELSLPQGAGEEPWQLVSESLLHHGPVLLLGEGLYFGFCAGTSRLSLRGLPAESARLLAEAIGPYLATATSRVNFAKQTVTSLRIPQFSLAGEEGKIAFAGLEATIAGDLALRHLQGRIATGALTLTLAEGALELDPGVISFDLTRFSDYLHLGQVDLRVARLLATSGEESLRLQGLDLASRGAIVDGRLNLAAKIAVAEIAAPFPLTAASYRLEINRVDPESFAVFGRMAAELNEAVLDPAVEFPRFYEGKVRELVSAVLQKGVQCNQGLDFRALGGEVKSDLQVEFVGLPVGVHPLDVRDYNQFLAAVRVALTVAGEERVLLASPAAPLVEGYLEEGLISREKETLRLEASLSDGQLRVGGKSLPLAAFLRATRAAQR